MNNNSQILKDLEQRREELIARYIGVYDKPMSYYNSLSVLDKKIDDINNNNQ